MCTKWKKKLDSWIQKAVELFLNLFTSKSVFWLYFYGMNQHEVHECDEKSQIDQQTIGTNVFMLYDSKSR